MSAAIIGITGAGPEPEQAESGRHGSAALPPKGIAKAYPDFKGDNAAEIIWLQSQLIHSQDMLLYQSERLRLRADLWEAKQELSLLHYAETGRLRARVIHVEMAFSKLIAACSKPGGANEEAVCQASQALGMMTAEATSVAANEKPQSLTEAEHNAYPKGRGA